MTIEAMYWICIVKPSNETFESLKKYLIYPSIGFQKKTNSFQNKKHIA
jgi:hypothetical protein